MADETINEAIYDAALRHAIGVRRFATGEVKKAMALLEAADKDIVAKLRTRLGQFAEGSRSEFSARRLQELLKDIREARAAVLSEVARRQRESLVAMAQEEAAQEQRLLTVLIPVEVSLAAVSLDTLRSLVSSRPFAGQHLAGWFDTLKKADQRRLEKALQLGILEGQTVDQMVRTVVGTRAAGYTDGILTMTRRDAEGIVRTAVNHVSNSAREALWEENADIISGLRWTATLDGRTTAVCRGRDGQVFPINSGPRPPAHFNCRSVMVAVLDGVAIVGQRPFVTDTRRPNARENDFRREARRTKRPIQELRKEWADRNVGQVPAVETYQTWLTRQSSAFQDEVLGAKKGELFRKGGIRLDQFIDPNGREFSLDELYGKYKSSFERAGVGKP